MPNTKLSSQLKKVKIKDSLLDPISKPVGPIPPPPPPPVGPVEKIQKKAGVNVKK